jgi:hypothetical protein
VGFAMLALRVAMDATRRAQEIMEGKSAQMRVPHSAKTAVWCWIDFEAFDNFNLSIVSITEAFP